jgi:hypothetical protein
MAQRNADHLNPSRPAHRFPHLEKVSLGDAIVQLRITLLGAQPAIWRQVLVPATEPLQSLHHTLQRAFGWQDCHLHEFVVRDRHYGSDTENDVMDEQTATLRDLVSAVGDTFIYEYDPGDEWIHEVVTEAILLADGGSYPRCVGGAMAGPPEDCGGPNGYADLSGALTDPSHGEHQRSRRWVGASFDPTVWDCDAINQALHV